jgi:hypothetical protein
MKKMSKKNKVGKNKPYMYSTDELARDTAFWLARDFANVDPSFTKHPFYQRSAFMPELHRDQHPLGYWGTASSVARFKRQYQLASLLKKYTFDSDVITPEARKAATIDKFLAHQMFLAGPRKEYRVTTKLVLREARKIIQEILGDPDMEEIRSHYKFGQRSSIGCPLADAFIDVKLCERVAFSSNWLSLKEFCKDIENDHVLKEHLTNAGLRAEDGELFPSMVESLIYHAVPKSYKIDRGITPLALLTLYLSYGTGGVVTERLKRYGIDIHRQQFRHKAWIRKYSRNRKYCTTDLTSASDSITLLLLMWLLPRKWLKIVKTFISRQMEIPGVGLVNVASVLPMGNGATFPLETLIFYALLKGIQKLTGINGRISVYGDDLIYRTDMHKYVVGVFGDLGILLNNDKTFTDAYFRESCGSDYFHGIDVRPAFFPAVASSQTRTQYCSTIYRLINNLLARWDKTEIARTLEYLLNCIRFTGLDIFCVPKEWTAAWGKPIAERSYPSDSGIQCDDPLEFARQVPSDGYSPIARIFENGVNTSCFLGLRTSANRRKVVTLLPYYWLSLKHSASESSNPDKPERFWESKQALNFLLSRDKRSELEWRISVRTRWFNCKGKRVKKVVKRLKPHVPGRDMTTKVGVAQVYDWSSRTVLKI